LRNSQPVYDQNFDTPTSSFCWMPPTSSRVVFQFQPKHRVKHVGPGGANCPASLPIKTGKRREPSLQNRER